jgi:hypothetical protein
VQELVVTSLHRKSLENDLRITNPSYVDVKLWSTAKKG